METVKTKKNGQGFALEYIIVTTVVTILVAITIIIVVVHHSKSDSNLNISTASSSSHAGTSNPGLVSSPSSSLSNSNSQTIQQKPSFNFVSTDSWSSLESPNGSFSIKIGDTTTWAYCDSANVIMVGLLDINYPPGTHTLKCSSTEDAIKATSPAYTYIAFGSASSLPSMPADAVSFDDQMNDGTPMVRYSYTDSYGGKNYDNIVYSAEKNGTQFLAWRRMPSGQDYSPNDNFETIVHKTWVLN